MNKYILIRKSLHILVGIIPLSYFLLTKTGFILLTGILLLFALVLEILRFKIPLFKKLFYKVVGNLLWDREKRVLTGATTFLFSSFICAIFFSKPVVIASLLFLAVGDTTAYLVGSTLGKRKVLGIKSIEGGLASFLISIPIIFIAGLALPIGITGALMSSVIELLPLKIDDNLSLPLIAGAIMELIL